MGLVLLRLRLREWLRRVLVGEEVVDVSGGNVYESMGLRTGLEDGPLRRFGVFLQSAFY